MYQIILATHGPMAEGMKESLKMFTDQIEYVHTLCLDTSGIHIFEEKADALIEQLKQEDTLILCDIGFATPFNVFAQRTDRFLKDVEIIAGVNMPALLEAVILQKSMSLQDITENFKSSIQAVSLKENLNAASNSDDE